MNVAACGAGSDDAGDRTPLDAQARAHDADGETLPEGSRELELLSEDELQLAYGAAAPIEVRLTDADGAPVEGARVSFALMGRAQDASLSSLDGETDADGEVTNVLIAGSSLATFRVRISTPGAVDRSVQVSVSDAGFGALLVDVDYVGSRLVRKRVVTVLANMACEDAMRMPGDPMATLDESVAEPARFTSLPAGASYAVVAWAEGQDETVVAQGCRDGVVVEAGEQLAVSVSFVDQPLSPAGRFRLTVDLASAEPASTLAETFATAALTLLESEMESEDGGGGALSPAAADARFMLDSLVGALQSEELVGSPLAVLGEAIVAARADALLDPSLDSSLASALDAAAVGPRHAAERIAGLAEQMLSRTRFAAELTVDDDAEGDRLLVDLRALSMEASPQAGPAAPLSVDLQHLASQSVIDPAAGDAEEPVSARFDAAADALVLEDAGLRAAFGTLTLDAVNRVVSMGEGGAGEEVRGRLGCAQVAAWLDAQALTATSCDGSCEAALCDRALARLLGAAEGALRPLDDARPVVELSGELVLQDEDGDLAVEALGADSLDGAWLAAEAGQASDAVQGSADGAAIEE